MIQNYSRGDNNNDLPPDSVLIQCPPTVFGAGGCKSVRFIIIVVLYGTALAIW